jgi:hypothetical protein
LGLGEPPKDPHEAGPLLVGGWWGARLLPLGMAGFARLLGPCLLSWPRLLLRRWPRLLFRRGSRSGLLLRSRSLFKLWTWLLWLRRGPGLRLGLGLGLNRPALRLLRTDLRLVLRAGLLRLNRMNLRLTGLDRTGLGLIGLDRLHLRTVVWFAGAIAGLDWTSLGILGLAGLYWLYGWAIV